MLVYEHAQTHSNHLLVATRNVKVTVEQCVLIIDELIQVRERVVEPLMQQLFVGTRRRAQLDQVDTEHWCAVITHQRAKVCT